MLAAAPMRSHFQQSVQVLTLKTQNADAIDVAEFAFAHDQSGAGNLDGIITSALAAAECLENLAGFLTASTSEFSHREWSRQALDNVAAVAAQQALIGASQSVLRQVADHLEQRRAYIVVQVFRRQFLLARFSEAGAHIGGEGIARVRSDSLNQHFDNSLSRRS